MLIKSGARGEAVKRIQKKVGVKVDGVFGPKTKLGVMRWQKAHGLTADGIVGPKTWGKMFPPAPGKRHIINDIGHGWHNTGRGVFDPGADPKGAPQEHAYAERFVDALTRKQVSRGAQVTVVEDTPLRARKADPKADATSWHFNSFNGKATGVEVWVPWGAGKAARAKAAHLGKTLADIQGIPWRGVKRTRHLAVLNHGFDRLVEIGFIDNTVDREAFNKHFDELVTAAAAII